MSEGVGATDGVGPFEAACPLASLVGVEVELVATGDAANLEEVAVLAAFGSGDPAALHPLSGGYVVEEAGSVEGGEFAAAVHGSNGHEMGPFGLEVESLRMARRPLVRRGCRSIPQEA